MTTTIKDVLPEFMAAISTDLTPNGLQHYQQKAKHLANAIGHLDPGAVKTADIWEFVTWMTAHTRANNENIKGHIYFWLRLTRWLADRGRISPVVELEFAKRKLPKLRYVQPQRAQITEEQHERLMLVSRSGRVRYWWATACLLAWHLGLRMSDVANAQWAFIDWADETYTTTPQKTRKHGKQVIIPMDAELVEWLCALRERPYYASPYIVPDMYGYYSSGYRGALRDQFDSLCQKANVPEEITFHCYRHAFVSRLVNAGVNFEIVSHITGMAIQQIATYTHVNLTARRNAMEMARQTMHRERLRRRGMVPQSPYQPVQQIAPPEAELTVRQITGTAAVSGG